MANIISATELKNKVSEILNRVYYSGEVTIVEKYGKPIIKLMPINERIRTKLDLRKALDATFGSLPDFPDVTKDRRSGMRKIPPLFE